LSLSSLLVPTLAALLLSPLPGLPPLLGSVTTLALGSALVAGLVTSVLASLLVLAALSTGLALLIQARLLVSLAVLVPPAGLVRWSLLSSSPSLLRSLLGPVWLLMSLPLLLALSLLVPLLLSASLGLLAVLVLTPALLSLALLVSFLLSLSRLELRPGLAPARLVLLAPLLGLVRTSLVSSLLSRHLVGFDVLGDAAVGLLGRHLLAAMPPVLTLGLSILCVLLVAPSLFIASSLVRRVVSHSWRFGGRSATPSASTVFR